MYLLNTSTFQLHRFLSDEVPPYVILSHTWGDDEVLFQDLGKPGLHYRQSKGFSKIDKCCAIARFDSWEYIWIDNCCIDQKSSAELSEAINSMYRWYKDAVVCYAYLANLSVSVGGTDSPRKKLRESRWFTRGWTLQELLAPKFVIFYDRDWIDFGTKHSLQHLISDATGMDTSHLFEPGPASAAAKMSWASSRETTRPEDIAYSLLGLFDVNMPLLYGEGATKAFERLQHEIIQSGDDESIFAWLMPRHLNGPFYGGMLAPSPECFTRSGNIVCIGLPGFYGTRLTLSNSGISLELSFVEILEHYDREREFDRTGHGYTRTSHAIYMAPLACADKERKSAPLKLHLEELMPREIARLLPRKFDYMAEESLRGLDTRTFHVNKRFVNKGLSKPPNPPLEYPSTFTFRLSLAAQGRLFFRGVHGGNGKLLSSITGDDGRLTLTATRTSKVHFQHERDFMVGFTSDLLDARWVHIGSKLQDSIDAQFIKIDDGESISVPLGDEEVLWMSSKYGCDQKGKLVIVDVDIAFKDKLDRESIT